MKIFNILIAAIAIVLLTYNIYKLGQRSVKEVKKPIEKEYVYFTDSIPKALKEANTPYENFSDTRKVEFKLDRDYTQKRYKVIWYLWIDGDIADSNIGGGYDYVNVDDIERYKAKIRRIENAKIPALLKLWEDEK